MGNATHGSKYSKNQDLAIVARRIRKDIRAAVVAGNLPAELKTSVTISRYSGGQSLGVEIKNPGIRVLCNTRRVRAEMLGNDTTGFYARSEEARELEAALVAIVREYNSTTSHGEHCNPTVDFYGSVYFTGGLMDACIARARAAFEAADAKAAAAHAAANETLALIREPAQLVLF